MVDAAYVDTSAFVKLYDAREPGAHEVDAFAEQRRLIASVLLLPETMSAIARKVRDRDLGAVAARRLRSDVRRDFGRMLRVSVSSAVLREAERLLFAHPLRASDAVHLASALVVSRTTDDVVPFVCADVVLADAADAEALDVHRVGHDSTS